LGLYDGVVPCDRDDLAPPDPATVEHAQGLGDNTVVQQTPEGVHAEDVELWCDSAALGMASASRVQDRPAR